MVFHSFIKEHNHELYPTHAHYFPCHRNINSSKKHSIDTLCTVGVGTNKILFALASNMVDMKILDIWKKT